MKKILFLILLILPVLHAVGQTQDTVWQNTNGPCYFPDYEEVQISFDHEGGIFVGTRGGGVYYSADNGDSWSLTSLSGVRVTEMAINANGDIYAAYAPLEASNSTILMRSQDKGATWTETGLPHYYVSDIVFGSEGQVFVSGMSAGGVYCSTDNGVTWQKKGLFWVSIFELAINGEGYLFARTQAGVFRTLIESTYWEFIGLGDYELTKLATNEAGDLFVSSYGGMFRSADNGHKWVPLNAPEKVTHLLGISPGGLIFATDQGRIFRSSDNGNSWVQVGPTDFGPNAFAFNSNGQIFTDHNNLIVHSEDDGETWNNCESMAASSVNDLAVNQNGLMAASFNNGLMAISKDMGDTWHLMTSPPGYWGLSSQLAVNDLGHIFIIENIGWYSNLLRTKDEGVTWQPLPLGVYVASNFLHISGKGEIYVYACDKFCELRRSSNNGKTWESLGLRYPVYAMATNDEGRIFAVSSSWSSNGIVYYSTDNGQQWTWDSITNAALRAIAINKEGTVFIGAANGEIFRSDNEGETWMVVRDLEDNITDIVINQSGAIFIATARKGVWISEDNGGSWRSFNTGLLNQQISALEIDGNGNLFAGTIGNGVFRNGGAVTSAKEPARPGAADVFFYPIVPNPFRTAALLTFTVSERTRVVLELLDMNGAIVKTIRNEEIYPPGTYECYLNGSDLPAGVYFCRLRTSTQVQTQKCVLVN